MQGPFWVAVMPGRDCGYALVPVVHWGNIVVGILLIVSGILSIVGLFTSLGGSARDPLGFVISLYVAYVLLVASGSFLCESISLDSMFC